MSLLLLLASQCGYGSFEMEIEQEPNPDLKWETTSSFNVGLEIGLFDNRLALDIDYYFDKSKDPIAHKGNFFRIRFSSKYVNYADVRNQGLDISLTGTIIKLRNGDGLRLSIWDT